MAPGGSKYQGRYAHSRQRLDVLEQQFARDDGYGDRELAGVGADRQRRHEWPGTRGLLGGAEHEHRDVFILVDLLEDLLGLLALPDHLLGLDRLVPVIVELAPEQAEDGARLVGLLLQLDLAHAFPELV